MKYRKKPVAVEAIQWNGCNLKEIGSLGYGARLEEDLFGNKNLVIRTRKGYMSASVGNYIICGVKGELSLCKPDIFMKTYEEVTE